MIKFIGFISAAILLSSCQKYPLTQEGGWIAGVAISAAAIYFGLKARYELKKQSGNHFENIAAAIVLFLTLIVWLGSVLQK